MTDTPASAPADFKVDFKIFIVIWNRRQSYRTPDIHFRMAGWLEECWRSDHKRLLLQAFRSSGKSTITGLFAAWLLYRNPNLRLLVLAADNVLACKMVRNVKRIIERHPLTEALKPERADQWGADRFTVRRRLELRDPSMLARGISANITGSRADVIICDDVEVPNTCSTPQKRADLRERLGEAGFVLVPGGTQLYIGTPHSWYTIYADTPRREIDEETAFLEGYKRLMLPILDANGQSAWPERYTSGDIALIRKQAGPNKFKSQMMLEPVNIAEGRLDIEALRFYEGSLFKSDELRALYLEGRRVVSASAWWDPAFGRNGGDRSVLAVIYTDENGEYWLHRVLYIGTDENAPEDEATQQCRRIAAAASEFHLPFIAVETNGIGKFLPAILRRELAAAKAPCAVREITSTRPKDLRIIEAFDAVLAARVLHVHTQVRTTPFVTEMQEWQPGKRGVHDDGLDAVAGALSLEPVRLPYERFSGRQHWRGNGQSHTAKTDFKV